MKILFDARFITPRHTGVGRSTELLLQALLQHHPDHHLIGLYHHKLDPILPVQDLLYSPRAFDDHPQGDIYRNFSLPHLIRKHHIDVFHSPAFYSIQRRISVPQVVTIHDLAVFDTPEVFPRKFVLYFRWLIKSACKRATLLLVTTRFNAERLTARFPNVGKKIRIVPFGIDTVFRKRDPKFDASVREKWTLPEEYILDVSTVEPRKNLVKLLEGYEIYRRRCPNPLPLIIAGKDGMNAERIKKRACHGELDFSVRFLGYLSTSEIASLYRMARFMVFPSVYEGLGLPVLEAMAGGCPVITSDRSALPEAAGDAACLVNPDSAVSIADAMVMMTGDDAYRSEFAQKGLNRAQVFTWEKTASKTVKAYEEAREIFREKGRK